MPRVHFGVGTGELLVAMRDAGADVMGIDHRVPLDVANDRLGGRTPLQGNIDPALLFAGPDALHAQAADVIRRGVAAPGHVVNLGHGVPPDTDPDVLTRLVEFVHDLSSDADRSDADRQLPGSARVVVIGGGIAGLVAALDLARAGLRPVRAGGRRRLRRRGVARTGSAG